MQAMQTSKRSRWRKAGATVALTIGVALSPAPSARALFGGGFSGIVFDPQNFAKNVEQIAQQIQMIQRLQLQLEAQLRALESWEFTRIDDIRQAMRHVEHIFRTAGEAYEWVTPGPMLDNRYPRVPGAGPGGGGWEGVSREDYLAVRTDWLTDQREAITASWTLQNAVVAEMPATGQRVAEYVERSNQAPGATAALQAGNEMLATVSGQLQQLQALQVSDQRLTLEQLAREEAEDAYAEQRRRDVMSDWLAPASAPGSPGTPGSDNQGSAADGGP